MKKVMVLTGGGDCPGLNAVIRAIVKRAYPEKDWEVVGSIEAFNGVLSDPQEVIPLDRGNASGIHVKGGTILKTTNKGNPFNFMIKGDNGAIEFVDRSDELIEKIADLGVEAVINIGGDGSQRISQKLYEKGLNIIGVPKTIDNDLSATDLTFGFRTAVQIATDAFDKLVTTAESHHRVLILEVMGRDAGWIALHTAIAGGAEVCLIPEVPYNIDKVVERINKRYKKGKGFANIVISEGAKPVDGEVYTQQDKEPGSEHVKLGGVDRLLADVVTDPQMPWLSEGSAGDTEREFSNFLDDVSVAVEEALTSPKWREDLARAILKWEADGYSTTRLERHLDAEGSVDAQKIIRLYEKDIAELKSIAAQLQGSDPAALGGMPITDPEQLPRLRDILASVRRQSAAEDDFFRDREKVVWDWPVIEDRLIESWDDGH